MFSDSSSEFHSDDNYSWIPWFCSLKGNEFFCAVDVDWARDNFNLTGLSHSVIHYNEALDLIVDAEQEDSSLAGDDQEDIENDAEILYGLIHSRFILCSAGMQSMFEKYNNGIFGRCPRVSCAGHPVLPVGTSDIPNVDSIKIYCPKCEEIYNPRAVKHDHIDGAFFGTTFPHLFFLNYPEWRPESSTIKYVPKCFGFMIHSSSHARALAAKEQDKEHKRRFHTIMQKT